ncbi:MAG: hypothetical protein V1689_09845, partial [Pseudomonadota bacterium]
VSMDEKRAMATCGQYRHPKPTKGMAGRFDSGSQYTRCDFRKHLDSYGMTYGIGRSATTLWEGGVRYPVF